MSSSQGSLTTIEKVENLFMEVRRAHGLGVKAFKDQILNQSVTEVEKATVLRWFGGKMRG